MGIPWLDPALRLANPWALAALAALPLWLGWRALRRRRDGGLCYPQLAWLGPLPVSRRLRARPLLELLRVGALVAVALALARPQLGRERERVHQRGVDIMLALDVSGSMTAEDIGPNRLEVAKATIRKFVERLTTDRVGLVVFAGLSFTQCPLTTDYGVLVDLLRECHVGMVNYDGTAIGDALAKCVLRFEGELGVRPAAPGDARSRVVVLLTDGINNTGMIDPLQAAAIARRKGIRVHAVGVGSLEGAPVPQIRGGRRAYAANPDGTLQIARLDEPTLRSIADITGGQYFRAADAQTLERIYRRIAEMEKHDIEIEHLTVHEERYLTPLWVAIGLLLLELGLRAAWLRVIE